MNGPSTSIMNLNSLLVLTALEALIRLWSYFVRVKVRKFLRLHVFDRFLVSIIENGMTMATLASDKIVTNHGNLLTTCHGTLVC